MDSSVTLTLSVRVCALAADGLVSVSRAAEVVRLRRYASLASLVALAAEARCPVSYLIDPRCREADMNAEWTYSDEPQLLRFRRRLSQAMEMDGVRSADELARSARLSHACVLSYLRGTRLPSATSLVRLSRTLGVSCDWLLGFDKGGENPWR